MKSFQFLRKILKNILYKDIFLYLCDKNIKTMWQITLKDGTIISGNREEVAKQLNFMGDVYDDEVWDEFCSHYTVKWIEDKN